MSYHSGHFLWRYESATGREGSDPQTILALFFKHFAESQNKTSRACQRRLNYMLKNGTTADNVRLFLADVQRDAAVKGKQDQSICNRLTKDVID